jgi:hypothetical protein
VIFDTAETRNDGRDGGIDTYRDQYTTHTSFGDRREEVLEIEVDHIAPRTMSLRVCLHRPRCYEAVDGRTKAIKLTK